MHLFSRKLRLFSLLVCSSLLTALSVPQVISAAPSPGKLGGIKEIVASPGFGVEALLRWELTEMFGPGE